MLQHGDAPAIDDLCWGHGDGLLVSLVETKESIAGPRLMGGCAHSTLGPEALVELCSVAQGEDIGCVDLVVRTRVAGHGFLAGSGPVSVVLDGDAQGASMRSKPQRRLWNWVL